MADKDELFKGIDEAANSLFDQYIVKRTPPASPASPKLEVDSGKKAVSDIPPAQSAPPPTKAAEATPEPELDLTIEAPLPPDTRAKGDAAQLFTELEEALLTIDWDVSHNNLEKGRDLLNKLVAARGWTPTSPFGKITEQIDKVLASMLKSPANSPTSAPSQLKNALQAIKEADQGNGILDEHANKLLGTTLSNLQALLVPGSDTNGSPGQDTGKDSHPAGPVSIPQAADEFSFDLGLELGMEEDQAAPPAPGEQIPQATVNVLKSYGKALPEAIRLITPMEDLFASRPAMSKMHAAVTKLKAKLTDQQNLLASNFSSDYFSYKGLVSVNDWLKSQLDVLGYCLTRISKLEKLFSKTAGYEKLFKRSKNIRQILEKQTDAITFAVGGVPTQHLFDLTGEYPAVIQPTARHGQDAPAAAVSAVTSPETMIDKCIKLAKSIELNATAAPQSLGLQIRETLEKLKIALSGSAVHSPGATAAANSAASFAGHNIKCRWDWLLKTSWGGQLIGIAPEQVAFESKAPFPVNSFKNTTFFNLKKLKSMPWTNLQHLFSGELAELDNSVLNNMELEIANPPSSFPGSSKKKVFLTILYSAGKGKVYLIDSQTEAISVAEEALWVPGTSSQSDIAGTLTVYGSTMPVISID